MWKFILLAFSVLFTNAWEFNLPIENEEMYRDPEFLTKINQIYWSGIIEHEDISAECKAQIDRWESKEKWVFEMFDAWGKIPPGILERNIVEYGDFDQCMAINTVSGGVPIRGKYCSRSLKVLIPFNGTIKNFLSLSICIPDKCDPETLIKWRPLRHDYPFFASGDTCQTKEINSVLDGYDWAMISVLIVIGIFMIISTIFDGYLRHFEKRPFHPSLLSFSVLTNAEKIFTVSKNPDQILCLNGLRVISLIWIIAGHRYAITIMAPIMNLKDVPEWMNSFYSVYLQGVRVAVDTFFFLSAFLLSYSYFKNLNKKPLTLKGIPLLYIHRILRVTPALAAVFFSVVTYLSKISSGPIWPTIFETNVEICTKYWYSFFFYFQNYYNPDQMCIVTTWYLSADMQLFLCAPFVLIGIGYFKKNYRDIHAYIAAGVLILLTIFIPMGVEFTYENKNEYNTHTRTSVYAVGILMGMFIVDVKYFGKFRLRISYLLNICIWAFTLTAMLGCVLYTWEVRTNRSNLKTNLFNSFSRPIWGFGLGWIIYACITGKGGIVNLFLSWPSFQILSKLSYSMYLLHGLIIMGAVAFLRTSIHFSDYEMIYLWCGDYILSILLSVIWVLVFESPIVGIEKLIFGTRGARSSPSQKSEDMKSVNVVKEHEKRNN